jgi:hypothetical protein
MIPPNAEKVSEQDFRGRWRDDKGRILDITDQDEDTDLWRGFFLEDLKREHQQFYTKYFGVNAVDGSRLMERKRGEESGWD